MAQLVLVRHGQTEWNRVERFRGRIDVPLNETGRRQAQEAARVIAERYPVSIIYTGPLTRAADTAGAIGKATGAPVQILPALNDFSYGEWEGKGSDVAAAYPELYRTWQTKPHLASIPGAESLRGLRRRVSVAVEAVAMRHSGETVVLVSHRMVCKVLACYLLGLPNSRIWRLDLDTASVSLFERRQDGWVTLLLNDTGHLRGLA